MSDQYIIQKDTLTNIADKIREKKYQSNAMTPSQMVDELDELGYGLTIETDERYTTEDWVRPSEYPNPSVIDLTDFDGVYLTYDLRKTPDYSWIGVYVANAVSRTAVYFERGHIEGTEFVVDETFTGASASSSNGYYFRHELDEVNGEVQVWRVTSDGQIRRLVFINNSTTQAQNHWNTEQPCVERYGRLPYVADLSSNVNSVKPTDGAWITKWLQKDDVRDVISVTTMANAYNCAYRLSEIDFDGWDTSEVTSFANCFGTCYRIKSIPLQKIRTDAATTFASMFVNCHVLDNVNINHFNIDKVTTMANMFEGCRSLKNLEMSLLVGTGKLTTIASMFHDCRLLSDITRNIKNLNVSNVLSFAYTFAGCRSLKSIDLSSWNVTKVTSMLSTFDYCYALEYINLSGWDVTHVTNFSTAFRDNLSLKKIVGLDNFELLSVTTLASACINCYTLESFKIKTWDISKLTTTSEMFHNCYSLKEVDFTGWDVPNVITSMAYMFGSCRSLKKIHMPNMDFTASGTSFSNFLSGCYSLQDLDITNWHVTRISAFDSFFSNCVRLDEIDLTSWTVDSGSMNAKNSLNYVFNNLYNCKSIKIHFPLAIVTSGTISYFFDNIVSCRYLDIRNWNISKSTNNNVPGAQELIEYYPPALHAVSQSYVNASSLSKESLVRILEALPTITTAKTVTLGQIHKLKLTAEEIAIATEKGWTVA